jgi:hypothetical protein
LLGLRPGKPGKVYCGTYARGLRVSEDAGGTRRPVADTVP